MPAELGRGRTLAAAAVAAVSVLSLVALFATRIALEVETEPGSWGLGAAGAVFGLVGAVVIARVPGNRLGWVFAAISIAMTCSAFQSFARPLVESGVDISTVALGQVAADASFSTMLFLALVLTPSWFPTGRPFTSRWGWSNIPAAFAWVATVLMALFAPTTKLLWEPTSADDAWRTVANPIGVPWIPAFEESTAAGIAMFVFLFAALVAVASLVVRYRRSGLMARTQIRWLMAAFLFLIPTIVLAVVFGESSTGIASVVLEVVFGLAILAVPLSAGIAITKYRLFDLDRIVSRTVTYAIVVGGLVTVFAVGAAWLPQQLPFASNNLAVAASTLTVAALFNPLRRRVQRAVDRRFQRLPYDPDAVATDLASRLRSEVDTGAIVDAFANSANHALRPAAAGRWVKRP